MWFWPACHMCWGVTTVIFGKHIDKHWLTKPRRSTTLPFLIGEKTARYTILAMMVLPMRWYCNLILTRYFTPVMVLGGPGDTNLAKVNPPSSSSPSQRRGPEGFPDGQGGWRCSLPRRRFINNRGFRDVVHAWTDPGCDIAAWFSRFSGFYKQPAAGYLL